MLSVWHGTVDRTVDPMNADIILDQWRLLHGIQVTSNRVDVVDGHQHRVWVGREGQLAIEDYRIAGMGHGTPLRTRGERSCGNAGAYMLDCGISSTWHIANNWGLLDAETMTEASSDRSFVSEPAVQKADGAIGVQATIEDALRAAGLMR